MRQNIQRAVGFVLAGSVAVLVSGCATVATAPSGAPAETWQATTWLSFTLAPDFPTEGEVEAGRNSAVILTGTYRPMMSAQTLAPIETRASGMRVQIPAEETLFQARSSNRSGELWCSTTTSRTWCLADLNLDGLLDHVGYGGIPTLGIRERTWYIRDITPLATGVPYRRVTDPAASDDARITVTLGVIDRSVDPPNANVTISVGPNQVHLHRPRYEAVFNEADGEFSLFGQVVSLRQLDGRRIGYEINRSETDNAFYFGLFFGQERGEPLEMSAVPRLTVTFDPNVTSSSE